MLKQHRIRGLDTPDAGLKRDSYKFFTDVYPDIDNAGVQQTRDSLDRVQNVNNNTNTRVDSTWSTNGDISVEVESNDTTSMDVKDDDVTDGRLLSSPGRDQYDLADLARQNNREIPGQAVKTWPPQYKRCDLVFSLISLAVFSADLITDILLLRRYYRTGQLSLFYLTLAFILAPSLVSGGVSVVWSYIDYSQHARHNKNKGQMVIRCVFTFLQLGRVYRLVEFIYHMFKFWKEEDSEKAKEISLKAIEQKRDAAILGLMDGFLESALQLLVQLYLVIRSLVALDVLRVLALLSSWVSTALSVTSYYRTVRRAQSDRYNVKYGPSAVYMAVRLFELAPRFLLFGLSVSYFLYMFLGGVLVHIIVIFSMYMYINPRLLGVCTKTVCRLSFLLLVSFISAFCFINLKEGKTRWVVLFYYVVYYTENFLIMGVIVGLTLNGTFNYSPWYYTSYSVFPGLILHITLLILYYHFCHPHVTHIKKGTQIDDPHTREGSHVDPSNREIIDISLSTVEITLNDMSTREVTHNPPGGGIKCIDQSTEVMYDNSPIREMTCSTSESSIKEGRHTEPSTKEITHNDPPSTDIIHTDPLKTGHS